MTVEYRIVNDQISRKALNGLHRPIYIGYIISGEREINLKGLTDEDILNLVKVSDADIKSVLINHSEGEEIFSDFSSQTARYGVVEALTQRGVDEQTAIAVLRGFREKTAFSVTSFNDEHIGLIIHPNDGLPAPASEGFRIFIFEKEV